MGRADGSWVASPLLPGSATVERSKISVGASYTGVVTALWTENAVGAGRGIQQRRQSRPLRHAKHVRPDAGRNSALLGFQARQCGAGLNNYNARELRSQRL